MKITLEQLKKLIREAVEETHGGKPYSAEELMIALRDNPNLDLPEEEEELAKSEEGEEEDEDYYDSRPGDFARRRLEEGTIRLIYTNHGILTEERVRELKECGYEMEECGSWEVEGPSMRTQHDEPVAKVIILGPGQEDVLEEGDTSTPADGGSVTGTQVGNVGPQGIAGSAASANPGGANTVHEAFNRRAESLLEAWMEEELRGDQDELDVAPPYGELTGADFKNLGKKSAHKAGHEKKD